MTHPTPHATTAACHPAGSVPCRPPRKNLRFALNYAEMVIAMFAGMAVLGPL